MDRDIDGKPHDYSLYLAADQKIDQLKEHVRELFQREQANQEKIEKLRERVEMGVSRTGVANSEKISDLALKANNIENKMTSIDTSLQNHERILGRIMAGIFWVSFAGIMGSLIAMAYQILKTRLLGA